jgi:integrase
MPLEDIADLVGHKGTLTTETVYRKVIVPELRRGAEVMDRRAARPSARRRSGPEHPEAGPNVR